MIVQNREVCIEVVPRCQKGVISMPLSKRDTLRDTERDRERDTERVLEKEKRGGDSRSRLARCGYEKLNDE